MLKKVFLYILSVDIHSFHTLLQQGSQSIVILLLRRSKLRLRAQWLIHGDNCRTRIKSRLKRQGFFHSAAAPFPSNLNQNLQLENSPTSLIFLLTLYFSESKTPNQGSKLNDFAGRNYRNRSSRKFKRFSRHTHFSEWLGGR